MENFDTTKYYSPFIQKSVTVFDYCQKIINDENLKWTAYFGFLATLVPNDIIFQEPILREIHKKFPINKSGILKVEPYQNYKWHKDAYRGVCINMLLSYEHVSHCLFGIIQDDLNYYFDELKYQPYTFYLFNNKFPHSVINFDKPRYVFSLEFVEKSNTLLYPEIYNWAKDKNLLENT